MEVGTAEAEGAQTRSPHSIRWHGPGLQLGIHVNRRMSEINIRVGVLAMHTGRQNLLVQSQCCLQQSGGSRGSLEMSEIRLDRADGDRVQRQMGLLENVRHTLHFDYIADFGRGAMTFNVRDSSGR